MSTLIDGKEVRVIPIDRVSILNPRDRNPEVFAEIVQSIQAVGLKKPVTVTAAVGPDGLESFQLVCGEGRLKALIQLGETHVPAIVIDTSEEEAYIMSLVENLARRRYRPLELLTGLRLLSNKGYSASDISSKTGLSRNYIGDLLILIKQGEDRILSAVEAGHLPIRAALDIVDAGEDDTALQATLHEAYESGVLRGRALLEVRKLLKQRSKYGKSTGRGGGHRRSQVTANSLVRTYQQEVERQRMIVRRGALTQDRLLIVVSAMRKLLADENFVTLMRAEGLETMPKYLADRIASSGPGARK